MKRPLLKLLLFLVFSFFAYIVFILYITSGDTKEYEKHCSKYIPILETMYKRTGSYPQNLKVEKSKLDFKYSLQKCGYSIDNDKFMFYFSAGLSVGGYDSKEDRWWHD
ncbi:MAG TPA: hypothetical protein EYG94_01385 [Campylobacterales bacterium]|nr:hypothetical protein [Campylobacterales bacterium]